MNEWTHVKDEGAFKMLKAMGAKTETRNYVQLPAGWNVVTPRGQNGHVKQMPTGDKWIKGNDYLHLSLGLKLKQENTQKARVLAAAKLALNKGDLKVVTTRAKLEAAVLVTTKLTKDQVTGQITALIRDGWLKKAGPEQMKS